MEDQLKVRTNYSASTTAGEATDFEVEVDQEKPRESRSSKPPREVDEELRVSCMGVRGPRDKYLIIYVSFFLYGFAVLLPWNSILNSFDYLGLEMPNDNPASTYPFAVNVLLVVSQVVIIITGDKYTYTQRILSSLIFLPIILTLIPFMATLPEGINYWAIFAILVPFGAFSGMLQGTIYTMAAHLPFEYMGIVQLGSGVCGIACNLLRAMTLIIFHAEPGAANEKQMAYYSAITFMCSAAVILVLCFILHVFVVRKSKFYIYYLDWDVADQNQPLIDTAAGESPSDFNLIRSPNFMKKSIAHRPQKESWKNFADMAKRNFSITEGLLYALLYCFMLTFIVFPGVAFDTQLTFCDGLPNSYGWSVVCINTIYSVFDTVGRKMGASPMFQASNKAINFMSGFRTIFIGTFFAIAFAVWYCAKDWFIITNMVLFSFSNGYVSTLCSVKAPGTVSEEKRGQVGGFIGITLTLGIFLGSLCALALTPLVNLTK